MDSSPIDARNLGKELLDSLARPRKIVYYSSRVSGFST